MEFPPWTCVYAVEGQSGYVKIGWTTNMAQRFAALQHGSPVRLKVLGTLQGGRELETWFHRRFARSRVSGEWFHLSKPEQVALLRLVTGQDPVPVGQVAAIAERQGSAAKARERRRADQRATGYAPSTGQAKYSKVRTYRMPPGSF